MTIINALPFNLQNGTTADATQVDANFNEIVADVNANAAHNGVNNDITALTALTTPITPAQGGSNVWHAGTSTGAANAQVVASPTPSGYVLGIGNRITFTAGFTNTGVMTLQVAATAAVNVFKPSPNGPIALEAGEVVAGNYIECIYDGTQYQLYTDASTPAFGPLTILASAATTDLGTIPSHNIELTGTASITSFGSTANLAYPVYQVLFGGAMTIVTSGAIGTIGGTNIVTVSGDTAVILYTGAGNWTFLSYQRGSGVPLNFGANFLQNYLAGLTLSTAGGSGTFGIAAGVATNSTNAAMMQLASAYTKTTASWAVGTGNGGLDTGAIANTTWYHVFLIRRPDTGVVDVLFSLSPSAPTMPANYTQFRRIGSMKTDGSAHWLLFTQFGLNFLWSAVVGDVNTTVGTASALFTLSTPTGIKTNANIRVATSSAGTQVALLINSPDEAVSAVNTPSGNGSVRAGALSITGFTTLAVRTNTSAQVRGVADTAGSSIFITTFGWDDISLAQGL